MALTSREDKIEFLVRRRFGRAASALAASSVSLSAERVARKQPGAREAIAEYRARLGAMNSDELTALHDAECVREQ
jgi:hypothetical protein